ncbi:hypothetical protein [Burkholderia cepacia]|uniref:hypothetical protein n=1 Tax=Burkholderia cepacia TaxID=292 RepID=UPI0010FECE99|nr:hypothetical protein [Burkholderia cepacia]MCA8465787.1 hypothetical protein [Burkholderia cepacia]MDN7765496.1 hypothetical protein [Burkholderia cepacia]QCY07168.1 hypothetical protein EJ998_29815 [Burkholderia cepacia ATCC 25416]
MLTIEHAMLEDVREVAGGVVRRHESKITGQLLNLTKMRKLLAGLLGAVPGLSFAVSPLAADQRLAFVPREHSGPLDSLIDLWDSLPVWAWIILVIFLMLWGAAKNKRKK